MTRARDLADLANTGIFSPNAGLSRVGINSTSPNVTLDVGGGASFTGNVSVGGTLTYDDVTNIDSVGIITAQSGIHIDDSIVHIGDTNTKIRFPSADTFTIETGGGERVRVDSSGNTGINCTSGGGKLAILANASTYEGLELQTPSGDGSGEFHIGVHQTGTSNGRSIVFKRGGADGMDTESLRITADGKVGIGLTNPSQQLEVNSGGTANGVSLDTTYSGGPNIAFKVNGTIKSYIGSGGGFSENGDGDDLALRATDNLLFDIAGSEKLRITSGGQVLVGGTTVQGHANMDDLQVGDGSGNRGITISSGTAAYGTVAFGDSTDGSGADRYAGFVEYYHDDNSMRLGTSSGEKVRITSDGNVLFGNYFTSKQIGSFESSLQIQGTTGNTSSMSIFRYSADAGGSNITLGKGRGSAGDVDKPNSGDTIGAIRFQIANNNNLIDGETAKIEAVVDAVPGGGDYPSRLGFFTAPDAGNAIEERLRIHSGGEITMGSAHSIPSGASVAIRQASPQLSLYATPGNVSRITLGDTDDHDIGQIGYDNSDNSMFFATNAATVLSIDNAGAQVQRQRYYKQVNASNVNGSATRTLTITGLRYGTATIHFGGSDGNGQYVHFNIDLGGMMWGSGNGYNAEIKSTGYSGASYAVTKNNTSYVIVITAGSNTMYYSYTFESTSYTAGNYAVIAES